MTLPITLTDDVFWIGVNDRETHLFESLMPIPEGVSYNAYLINDEKVALIDTVKIDYNDALIENIKSIIGERTVDYLIINHIEPDHSGSIGAILNAFPDMIIVGNSKTANFLKGFYSKTENVLIIKENDVLELGQHRLKFFMTPMLHWPETMMTYEETKHILFSGDAFGGFGALNGGVFDDEVDFSFYEDEMLRYYANIVGKYSNMVQKALSKLQALDVKAIAATHGVVWRKNPQYVIDLYDRWSSYQAEDGVVIVYGSMYGNTKKTADVIARAFANKGMKKIRVYDAARTHISYLISEIWRYKAVVIGSSTYNGSLFPPIEQLISKMENSALQNKILGVFGSYSWSGESVKMLKQSGESGKLTLAEPIVQWMFAPDEEVNIQADMLATNIVNLLKE
ncbi:flavodoxin [Desulfuribacillus stibiiarsenatis]|uniref:Flavodoxin n=1 Tax=Desulfuribacillus stibiiarsenatis TaxID=1390249 RepID=A0A1E5L3B4_9FIRM|nr:FprA family A-type flavoprotein [Desulfuribacillus stibiiarsenatis]OEH84630.1 flavodoxin [Desulfuribacillus stibiiarsenatis]